MERVGSVTLQSGEKVVYVGNDEAQQGGVAIVMSETPISKMTTTARYYSKCKQLTVVQAYAPIDDAMDRQKTAAGHYFRLQQK